VVDGRPTLAFLDPSPTSGADYATAVVGNPWDLADPADVANLDAPVEQTSFVQPSFAGGDFSAVAVVVPPDPASDVNVELQVDPARPIDTGRFRWVTFQLLLDHTPYAGLLDRAQNGWGARVVWWNQGVGQDGGVTRAAFLYEGVNTITVDLWEDDLLDPGDPGSAQAPWRAGAAVSTFRLDPAETPVPTAFTLLDVRLTALPVPGEDGTFLVRFRLRDPEGAPAEVALFLDTDRAGFDGTPVGTVTAGPGDLELPLATGDLAPGNYWVYAVVTGGPGQTFRRYADAAIHIGPGPCLGRAGGAGDGGTAAREAGGLKPDRPARCAGR
jgi:hypothetical protein